MENNLMPMSPQEIAEKIMQEASKESGFALASWVGDPIKKHIVAAIQARDEQQAKEHVKEQSK